MSGLKKLIHEIHRRSLWQVLGIYVAGSWLAFEVAQTLTEGVGLPEWVPPLALVLLIIGLPIVIATAFVEEGVGSRARSRAPVEPIGDDQATEEPVFAAAQAPVTQPAGPSQPRLEPHHRLFNWRNAVRGGVLAFALLGIVTLGYMAMRSLGIGPAGTLVAKGLLDERAELILADFASADQDLARAATEAFRVDFAQSAVVTVLEPTQVARVLQRMARPTDAPLDLDLAREVAVREGIQAVIAGEINALGSTYVVVARIVTAEEGEELVAHRETASSEDGIIDALDKVSKRLRERIGESLRTLARAEALDRVTTSSLDALRKYSQALHAMDVQGDSERGITLLEEAVALDTTFAMAYRLLGTRLGNLDQQRARAREALTRAFELRDRLTERERYLAAAIYYGRVLGDNDRVITAYRNLLELNPSDSWALNNLAVALSDIKEYEQAQEYYLRAIAADSASYLPYQNAIYTQVTLGKRDEARALLDLFATKFPENLIVPGLEASFATLEGDYETAEAHYRLLRERTAGSLFGRSSTSVSLASIAATQGRFAAAESHLRDAMDADLERGLPPLFIMRSIHLGALWLFVMERPDRALETIDAALERHPLDSLDPMDIPYTWLAKLYADAGRPGRARELLEEFDEAVEPSLQNWDDGIVSDFARVAIAMAEGRADEAVDMNRRGSYRGGNIAWDPQLGRAFDQAGQPDSAIVAYERYLETGSLDRLRWWDWYHRGSILERLGELHDAKADVESAAKYYAMFVELWAEADEELQPRVQAAQARLEEIVRARG